MFCPCVNKTKPQPFKYNFRVAAMITIFNRKQVYSTFNMAEQANIQAALYNADINYYLKTVNLEAGSLMGTTRSRAGSLGMKSDTTYQYIFYVHKTQEEEAGYVISKACRR